MTETAATARVLLVVESAPDRDLLRGLLEGADGVVVATAGVDAAPETGQSDPFASDFDVCVLDAGGLRAHGDALASRRESARTHLPTLLVDADGDPEATLDRLPAVAEHVDETVAAPVRPETLERRVRTLARTGRFSTELVASRSRLRRLVERLPDPVFLCAGGDVTYANPAAGALLGAETEDLDGRALTDLVSPADRDAVRGALDAADADGRGGPVETALTCAGVADASDGRESLAPAAGVDPAPDGPVPVEITTVDADDGDVQVLARDLRERRERESRLALYRRAMDEANVGITIADRTDGDETLTYVNGEFERLTGLSEDEVLGRNPRFLQTDATDPESVARLRAAIDDGEEASAVLLNRRGDGRTWYNALDISPIRDDCGAVTHYLGFQRDVTERVAQDQRLTVLDRVLRHNVRNRLNVVLGYADRTDAALADVAADPSGVDVAAVRADVDRIRAAAVDILGLSDSARRFREDVIGGGAGEPVDAAAVVTDVASALAADDEAAAAEVRLSTPEEPVCVADAGPLSLVVEELVSNALQHVEAPAVEVSLAVEGDEAVLRVADDGPGITADCRTALGVGTETATEHGQGVGLWLVRWTVDAAGGSVAYEEASAGGSVVVVRLPRVGACAPEPGDTASGGSERVAAAGDGGVDDDRVAGGDDA